MGKKKVNPTQEEVTAAYQEVLGRKPDPGGLETYMNSGLTGDALRKNLASSTEASIRAGKGKLDLNKYGIKTFELQKLDKGTQETFEKYKKKFNWGEKAITKSIFNEIKQMRYMFKTPEAEQEYWKKNVLIDRGPGGLSVQLTEQSITNLGLKDKYGNFDLAQSFAGTEGVGFLFPSMIGDTKVFLRGKRFADQQQYKGEDGSDTGLSYTSRIAAPKSGFFGEVFEFFDDTLGMGPDGAAIFTMGTGFMVGGVPGLILAAPKPIEELTGSKAGYFITDPVNLWSGLTYGTEGFQKNIEAGASIFNTSEDKVYRAQGIGRGVAKTAALALNFVVPGLGTAVSLGISAVESAQAVHLDQMKLNDALAGFAIDVAASSLQAGAFKGINQLSKAGTVGRFGALGLKMGASAAITTGQTAAKSYAFTGDANWNEAMRAGAMAGLSTGIAPFTPSIYGVNLGSTAVSFGFARDTRERQGVLINALTSGVLNATGYLGLLPKGTSEFYTSGELMDPLRDMVKDGDTQVDKLAKEYEAAGLTEDAALYRSMWEAEKKEYYSQGFFGRIRQADAGPTAEDLLEYAVGPTPAAEEVLQSAGFSYETKPGKDRVYPREGAAGFFDYPGRAPDNFSGLAFAYEKDSYALNLGNFYNAIKQTFFGRPDPIKLEGEQTRYADIPDWRPYYFGDSAPYSTTISPDMVSVQRIDLRSATRMPVSSQGEIMPRLPYLGRVPGSEEQYRELIYGYEENYRNRRLGLTADSAVAF